MRLASVITPFNDRNLALAAQTGVTDITIRYQGPELADWLPAREQVERHGLKICTVEDALQTEEIIMGTAGRDEEIEAIKQLLQNMSELEIPVLCYNFMAGTDWVRTSVNEPERGGARVTGFDLGRWTRPSRWMMHPASWNTGRYPQTSYGRTWSISSQR